MNLRLVLFIHISFQAVNFCYLYKARFFSLFLFSKIPTKSQKNNEKTNKISAFLRKTFVFAFFVISLLYLLIFARWFQKNELVNRCVIKNKQNIYNLKR